MTISRPRVIAILAASILFAACSASDANAPARATEEYLKAIVAKDADRISQLTCADWADDAQQTLDSFAAVDLALDNLKCTTSDTQGDTATVNCTGSISTTYNGEVRQLDLSEQAFTMTQVSGNWLVCGVNQTR